MRCGKPTFARIGKKDDPASKSRGGNWIVLNERDFETEKNAIFVRCPSYTYMASWISRKGCWESIVYHESSYHFSRGYK